MNAKRYFLLFVVIVALATSALAQLPTATLVGNVTDPTNAAIVGAKITVRDMSTNNMRTAVTTAQGEYTVSALLPGTYEVTISQTGFRLLVESNLALAADQTARLDAKLEIGGDKVVLNVDDTVGAVNTETSSKGDVVAPVEIAEMPLDGRDPNDLVFSIAGVVPSEEGSKGTAFTTNGARSDSTSVMIEGLNNTNPRDSGAEASPPLDSLQEFKMQTSGYSAEYGRVAGGVINMVMKRGGNQFHGGLFEFVRNDLFDAGNYFDAPGQKSKLRRNQFGATLGGPVMIPHVYNGRDKTFFFSSWESYRQVQGSDSIGVVPSLLERGNNSPDPNHPSMAYDFGLGYLDFSQSFNVNTGYAFNDPVHCDPTKPGYIAKNCHVTDMSTGKMSADNHLPKPVNPVVKELLQYYPLPTPGFSIGGNNYRAYAETPDRWDNVVIKIDQQISAKDSFSARATGKQEVSTNPFSGSDLGTFGSTTKNKQQMYGITETRIFTPTLINEFRLGLTRMKNDNTSIDGGINWARVLGMCPSVSLNPNFIYCPTDNPRFAQFPSISPAGYMDLGDNTSNPVRYTTNNYDLNDVLTWNKGKHTVKFGGDVLRVQYFQATNSNYSGSLSFNGKTSNNAIADFLVGKPNSITLTAGAPTNHIFDNNYSVFVQDDYKLSSALTLNLGLRYELDTLPSEANGQWGGYVPSLSKTIFASGMTPAIQAVLAKYPAISANYGSASDYGIPKTLSNPNYKRLAPRVGFAWRPFDNNNRTVIRAGYGIFYTGLRLTALRTDLAGQFPFSQSLTYSGQSTDNAFDVDPGLTGISNAKGIELHPKSAYLQSWNFTVENEIGAGVVVELAYTGSKASHLARRIDINQEQQCQQQEVISGQCAGLVDTNPTAATYLTPLAFHPVNKNFSTIKYYMFNSDSSYNAGTITLRKQFSHGLFFRVNYMFSKALDDASGVNYSGDGSYKGAGGAQNSLDPGAERGRSDFDRRHVLNGNFVYALPIHKNVVLRAWQLAGNTAIYSGAPFTPELNNSSGTPNNMGYATRPNRVCDGSLSNPTPTMWYNLGCFQQPTYTTSDGVVHTNVTGVFGNSGRNILDGPGNITINLSLSRTFQVTESGKLQFRWEVFNVLNHPNFNLPNQDIDTPGAGTITKAKAARIMQLGAKYNF